MNRLFYLFIICILAGCVHVPDRDVAHMKPAPSLSQEITDALSSGICRPGNFPSETWWEMFQDETLSTLMTQGFQNNPSLQVVQDKLSQAEASSKKERAALFPHLNLIYNETWDHLSKNGLLRSYFPPMPGTHLPHQINLIDLALDFSYELDFWGKNRNLFAAAIGKERAQRAEVAEAKLLLSIQIAHTYVAIQTLFAQKEVIENRLKAQKQLSFLSFLREDKGIDSVVPVLDAHNEYEQISHLKTWIEGEIAVHEHFLHSLIGIGPEEALSLVKKSLPSLSQIPLPQTISADLLARRPDLEAQICRVESAAHLVGAAKADFYPSVNLIALAGLESLSFSNLFNISSRTGGLIPALHLPIFKGGEIKARFREKIAEFNAAVHNYHGLLLQAAEEVANSLFLLQTRAEDLKTYQTQVSLKERLVYLSSRKVSGGIGNNLDLIQSQENLLKDHFLTLKAKQDYLFTVLDLIRSLGGGYLSGVIHEEPSL